MLVRRDASAPVVAIVTYVNAGYFDETDDVVGIAHVLEHMFFKGTPTRGVGEIAKQTKAVGGYLNAATIYDHTSYYTVLPSSGFAAGLDVQSDAYANSLIDADELARELEVIIQEAKRKADNPGAVATETLYELLHDRHRIRRWRIGREPGLRALDARRDARASTATSTIRATRSSSIVGDVDPDEAMRGGRRALRRAPGGHAGAHRPARPRRAPPGFRYREWTRRHRADAARVRLAHAADAARRRRRRSTCSARCSARGRASRLYRAVRERKLASSVSAYDYTPTALGVFVVHAETPPERAADAARAIWAQVRDAARARRERGASSSARKRMYESRWVRRLEDMEGQANYLAEWEALGDWPMRRRLPRARARGDDGRDRSRSRAGTSIPTRRGVVVYRPKRRAPSRARRRGDARAARRRRRRRASTPTVPPPTARRRSRRRLRARARGGGRARLPHGGGRPGARAPQAGRAIVHAGVYALGGARDEPPAHAGLTTLLVRTALKGTTRRTRAADRRGGASCSAAA